MQILRNIINLPEPYRTSIIVLSALSLGCFVEAALKYFGH